MEWRCRCGSECFICLFPFPCCSKISIKSIKSIKSFISIKTIKSTFNIQAVHICQTLGFLPDQVTSTSAGPGILITSFLPSSTHTEIHPQAPVYSYSLSHFSNHAGHIHQSSWLSNPAILRASVSAWLPSTPVFGPAIPWCDHPLEITSMSLKSIILVSFHYLQHDLTKFWHVDFVQTLKYTKKQTRGLIVYMDLMVLRILRLLRVLRI